MTRYIARLYVDKDEIARETGDDLDQLYNWLLVTAQGKFGNFHGEITDNKTKKVVKRFRKSPPD